MTQREEDGTENILQKPTKGTKATKLEYCKFFAVAVQSES